MSVPTSAWSCSFRTDPSRGRNTAMKSGRRASKLAAYLTVTRGGAQRFAEAKKLLEAGADLTARDDHLPNGTDV